ncbi:MAG: hypothetical protein AAGH79_12495, partial [Bacteroidota bacterium]
MNRIIILLLLLLPALAFSQRPVVPDRILNEGVIQEDASPIYIGYRPQILPISAIRADCSSTHDVEFLYSRECRPQSITLDNGNIYNIPLDLAVCRGTNEGYGFPSGSVCQITLSSFFLEETLERISSSMLLPYVYDGIPRTRFPYFTITIDFGSCGTVSRTIKVIDPTANDRPIIINDWTSELTIIQAGVPVKGAILGSILSGCYAYCDNEPKTCGAVTVTLTDASGFSWGPNAQFQLSEVLSLGGEVQWQSQSGVEITAEIPAATISAGPGELCVPLFSIISDFVAIDQFQYTPGGCDRLYLGSTQMIRPRGGANTVSFDGEKFCYDIDCGGGEFGAPSVDPIPGTIQDNGGTIFNIRFDVKEQFLRGSIEIEWEGMTPEDPFFIEDVAPGTYCYSITTPCCPTPIEGCLEVCPNATEGEWEINEDGESACRQINCPTGVPLQGDDGSKSGGNGDTYEECVPLAFDAYEFDEFTRTCRRAVRIAATGELLSYQSKAATFVDTYDEALGVCVREYYCDESAAAVEQESQVPNYGNWDFDLNKSVCFREVSCFGETMPGQRDTKDPTYDWSFDDFTDNCKGVVLCDGSPVFGALPVIKPPIFYGFW